MDFKDAKALAMSRGQVQKSQLNAKEDALAEAFDMKRTLVRHAEWIEKLREGKVDVGQFFSSISPDVAVGLLEIATTAGDKKTRLAAIQDILDRAGHGKVNKHAIASVDPSQPKDQLISMLLGLNKKSGLIEIEEDDDQDQEK